VLRRDPVRTAGVSSMSASKYPTPVGESPVGGVDQRAVPRSSIAIGSRLHEGGAPNEQIGYRRD
jgi:hypothetical protein